MINFKCPFCRHQVKETYYESSKEAYYTCFWFDTCMEHFEFAINIDNNVIYQNISNFEEEYRFVSDCRDPSPRTTIQKMGRDNYGNPFLKYVLDIPQFILLDCSSRKKMLDKINFLIAYT